MFKRFFGEESGASMVEYALLVALIAVMLIGALTALQGGIQSVFNSATAELNNAAQ